MTDREDRPIVIGSSTGVSIMARPAPGSRSSMQSMSLTKNDALDVLEALAVVLGFRLVRLPSGALVLERSPRAGDTRLHPKKRKKKATP